MLPCLCAFLMRDPFCSPRLLKGPCSEHVNATESRGAAPPRRAGCSSPTSGRWAPIWRRSIRKPWRWTCSGGQATAQPVAGPSPRPSVPSPAKSSSTWRIHLTTAWRTKPWAWRARRDASASRRARVWAAGRSAAASVCVESVAWPWRSGGRSWCPAATASSTGAARSSVISAARLSPNTTVWRRGRRPRAPATAKGKVSGSGRHTEEGVKTTPHWGFYTDSAFGFSKIV